MKLNIQKFTMLINNLKTNIANDYRYINYVEFFYKDDEQRKKAFFIKTELNLYAYTNDLIYVPVSVYVMQNNDGSVMIADNGRNSYGIKNGFHLLQDLLTKPLDINEYQHLIINLIADNPYNLKFDDHGNISVSTSSDQRSIINGINYLLNLRTLILAATIQKNSKEAS